MKKKEKPKYNIAQATNPERQEKNRIMKEKGFKSGKQYRKWIKEERREKKKINGQ